MLPSARRPSIVLHILLLVLFAISVRYQLRITEAHIEEVIGGQHTARSVVDLDLPALIVSADTAESEAAGVHVGDRLVAIAGRAVRGTDDAYPPQRDARPGDTIVARFEPSQGSGRAPYDAVLTVRPFRDSAPTLRDWLTFAIIDVALPYLCLLLGFWVVAVRVRDRVAWLLLLLLLGLAEFGGTSTRALYGIVDWFHPIAAIYQPVLANLWPLSMMLFGIYFPDRLPFDRRHPWAKWLVIVPVLFRVLGTNVAQDLLTLQHADIASRIETAFAWMRSMVTALHLVAIAVFFTALGFKRFMERDPDARRRLRLLHAGATMALTPLLVAFILAIAGVFDPTPVMPLLLALLFIFPLTMAYVIVVERALDVRLVVRQGVQYVLARGSIRVLQIAGSIVIFYVAVDRFQTRQLVSGSSLIRFVPIAIGVAAIVGIGRFSERLQLWVDRRFFREAYNAEQVLADLATQVRTFVETQPLLETVSRQVSAALHVPRLAILLNSGGMLQPAYAVGYGALRAVPAPPEPAAVATDAGLRAALDAELVLPLSANQKLLGVMGLGPKRSEEPFTSSDVRLLDAVAAQTGLALENSRLTAQVASEIADREKRKREMEIAREVQQRLFPQSVPQVTGLELAGACRPALAIGGDYYDFVPLADGRLGVAIGDISGKGIPAALLMATLRAYLRGQTVQVHPDLAAMIGNLNGLVFESSDSNRYATFFYGEYDPATRVFDYVNAGHNPPMVFRGNPGDVIRLDVGGPVLGLLPAWTFEQARVTLQPGDLFVSFTDGISEAMNGDMEEWGEEQLIATVIPASRLPLTDLIGRIMAGADQHTGAAPQHDDMTLVLARCV